MEDRSSEVVEYGVVGYREGKVMKTVGYLSTAVSGTVQQ